MMEKLMVDDLVHWARDYKVDGFRFDLMGHHLKRNLERIRDALHGLTLARDGVDGGAILLYGEGWDFGEVSGNQRGVNATQRNLAGTGVGTFNDRLRDAVRGGNPFTDRREQGFASGLSTAPAEFNRGGDADRVKLLDLEDKIRVGLAGNLAAYSFTDRKGNTTTGGALGGTGYTADPQECINYVEAHDNETLWDKLAYATPATLTRENRVRMQVLALSVVALAQGVPFFHAGGEILRTKSMDADSYDSGDWFNRIDWTHATNDWGMGLPLADKNRDRWPIIGDRLRRADLAPARADIEWAFGAFRDLLEIRSSSPLFRLRTAEDVQQRVGFLNTGPAQAPGVIVMTLSDAVAGAPDLDPRWSRIVVVFNATPTEQRVTYPAFGQLPLELHPVQQQGRDPIVSTAHSDRVGSALVVPAWTTAVFAAK
jgi:pullulanase-type alpha-1,6-glucosidase